MKEILFWKKKSTRIILAVSMFLIMICVIQILRPNREYLFEGEALFREETSAESRSIYEGIQLPPGVYRLELTYFCNTDMQNHCTVQDNTVFKDGLLTNGEHLYSGLSKTNFSIWLFENADALQIIVEYGGQGTLKTGDLHIYETNQLWGIYLTVILFFTILILSFRFLLLYDRVHPISGENKNVMFALLVLILVSSIPCLSGSTISGADLTYHLHRIEGIREGILSGQFPVRLEPQWVHGHGYANGIFYCGTLLLFPALLRIIGFPVTFSYNCYCIVLNIATVWISYYSFSRIFRNKYIGVAGSALYTLSVFRIYKLIINSAVGEGSAVTFMPLIVYGFWRVLTQDKHDREYRTGWIPLALGYAGLIQTHVLSCEITLFLTIIICITFAKRIFCRERFWELCKGALGALVLSLWFLVPFLDYYVREDLHIKHVSARTIQEYGLSLTQLLFIPWETGNNALSGTENPHSLGIGFILVLGFLAFGILWFGGRLAGTNRPIWKLGKVAWILGALLMLMSLEFFPWNRIQNSSPLAASLVSSLQFPNRFLGWGSVFLVLLVCCCLYSFQENQQKVFYFAAVLCILASLTTSSMYLYDNVLQNDNQFALYNPEGMGFGYISGAEYLVQGTHEDTLLYRDPIASENVLIKEYEKGSLRAEFVCDNPDGQEGYIDFPLLHYYGYKAYDNNGNKLQVCKGDNNVVRVIISSGHDIQGTVKFVSPWYWRISEIISLLGGVGILWIIVQGSTKRLAVPADMVLSFHSKEEDIRQ